MPYIITITLERLDATREQTATAVATLEEACGTALDVLARSSLWDDPNDEVQGQRYRELSAEMQSWTEHGGTVGPLLDGTFIEVEPIEWLEVYEALDFSYDEAESRYRREDGQAAFERRILDDLDDAWLLARP